MRFENILYVAEAGAKQDQAIARAVALASANHAHLTVVDVVTEQGSTLDFLPGKAGAKDFVAWKVDSKLKELKALIAPYQSSWDIEVSVLFGDKKYLEVVKGVLSKGYDLVIKSAEDPAWINRLFGSEDMHLLRKCPCPLWFIKQDEPKDYRTILAAVDFNVDELETGYETLSQRILRLALGVAAADSASLHIVHAWDAPEAQFVRGVATDPDKAEREIMESVHQRHWAAAEKMLRALKDDVGEEAYAFAAPKLHLLKGPAHREIPAFAKRISADLVAMGTVARSGIPGLIIGNTAEAILDQIDCSLLALKPKGFISPVR